MSDSTVSIRKVILADEYLRFRKAETQGNNEMNYSEETKTINQIGVRLPVQSSIHGGVRIGDSERKIMS